MQLLGRAHEYHIGSGEGLFYLSFLCRVRFTDCVLSIFSFLAEYSEVYEEEDGCYLGVVSSEQRSELQLTF